MASCQFTANHAPARRRRPCLLIDPTNTLTHAAGRWIEFACSPILNQRSRAMPSQVDARKRVMPPVDHEFLPHPTICKSLSIHALPQPIPQKWQAEHCSA
ncbi:MAG: hypothetical protein ACK56I_00560, partial [bacterium]